MTPSHKLQGPAVPNSYKAEDFHRLTNRVALSPLTLYLENAGEFIAEQTNNRETFASADKRPIASVNTPPCGTQSLLCTRIRQGSCSSVKEEGSGKLMYKLAPPIYPVFKGLKLINHYGTRHSAVFS